MRIAILGATGPAGRGLAARFADAGFGVVAGSRDPERARAAVEELRGRWGDRLSALEWAGNDEAVDGSDVVVLALPWQAAAPMAAEHAGSFAGRVVVSMANALVRREGGFEALVPPEGSVAAAVQAAAPASRVVAAFHHLPARSLADLDTDVEGDVLLCSHDREAARLVAEVAAKIPGVRPIDTGGLENAVGIEAFTAVLLSVNVRNQVRSAVRLTGIEHG